MIQWSTSNSDKPFIHEVEVIQKIIMSWKTVVSTHDGVEEKKSLAAELHNRMLWVRAEALLPWWAISEETGRYLLTVQCFDPSGLEEF